MRSKSAAQQEVRGLPPISAKFFLLMLKGKDEETKR